MTRLDRKQNCKHPICISIQPFRQISSNLVKSRQSWYNTSQYLKSWHQLCSNIMANQHNTPSQFTAEMVCVQGTPDWLWALQHASKMNYEQRKINKSLYSAGPVTPLLNMFMQAVLSTGLTKAKCIELNCRFLKQQPVPSCQMLDSRHSAAGWQCMSG